jgi:hypothetical protein
MKKRKIIKKYRKCMNKEEIKRLKTFAKNNDNQSEIIIEAGKIIHDWSNEQFEQMRIAHELEQQETGYHK